MEFKKQIENHSLVQLGGHFGGIRDIAAIHQPKSSWHSGRKGDTVVDKCQGRGTGDILPLSSGRSA